MDQQYLSVFLEEAEDHLQALNENILKLEKTPEDIAIVSEIFRSAHTFKGMSATMGFTSIADLTHDMENVLDDIRNEVLGVTDEVIDVILECIENLENMVVDIQGGGNGNLDVSDTVQKLKSLQGIASGTSSSTASANADSTMKTDVSFGDKEPTTIVRVNLAKDCMLKGVRAVMVLDNLKEVGEVLGTYPEMEKIELFEENDTVFDVYMISETSPEELSNAATTVSEIESVEVKSFEELKTENNSKNETASKKEVSKKPAKKAASKIENKSIRVNLEKIEQLMNMFEETVIERGRIEEIARQTGNSELNERLERLSVVSKDLQNIVLNMRMVPVETVFNRFPRMVRSLSKEMGKSINLIIEGADTEIDRIVIDEIGDPLVHLIRNSVDHGIETKEVRRQRGKDETGTVKLEAFHSGNNVVIQITDDGNGIPRNKVLEKAIKNRVITESEGARLSDSEVYDLIFQPGFSTAETISDISGRGVGLDVVKTTITKLGGSLNIKSTEGQGSVFRIELPLTLSIIQSMLIEAKGNRYAIPLGNIVETMRIPIKEIQDIQGKDVMNYRDKTIQIISLANLFHSDSKEEWLGRTKADMFQAVIIKSNERTYALAVDDIQGQREIVLKTLGNFFKDGAQYFSGATILGDGNVVLILDCDTIRK